VRVVSILPAKHLTNCYDPLPYGLDLRDVLIILMLGHSAFLTSRLHLTVVPAFMPYLPKGGRHVSISRSAVC